MKALVTGGCGYIGSSIASALIDSGHTPVILDSLLTGKRQFAYNRHFYEGDIGDRSLLEHIFHDHPDITAVIHCAALIVVPESVEQPYEYYRCNVARSLELFRFLETTAAQRIIFSSSASIYGAGAGASGDTGGDASGDFEVTEETPPDPMSPYARSKYMLEMVLQDFCRAYDLCAISLRYFNPAGADPKLRSGSHIRRPSHVLGRILDVAVGSADTFFITGVDWPTRDGSGLRDYIHVYDLARAHVIALERFDTIMALPETEGGYYAINLGSGSGTTVRELLSACARVIGSEIPSQEAPRRPGDVAGSYANHDRARRLLDWRAEYGIDAAIEHDLQWRARRAELLGY